MKASRAIVLDWFSAERAERVQVGDLWTWILCKTISYVAIVAYGQSFSVLRKKSAQLGLYTVATTLEQVVLKLQLNDSFHSAWGIAVKMSTTLACVPIWQTVSRQPRYRICSFEGQHTRQTLRYLLIISEIVRERGWILKRLWLCSSIEKIRATQ